MPRRMAGRESTSARSNEVASWRAWTATLSKRLHPLLDGAAVEKHVKVVVLTVLAAHRREVYDAAHF